MAIDPFQLPKYDLVRGIEFVAVWVMIVFCLVLVLGVRAHYRLMNTYDALNSFKPTREKRARVILTHIKRVLFAVLGYQGEERERETLEELDEKWIIKNRGKIMTRFCVFYFIYIWALILTTRALFIDPVTGQIELLPYTSKQILGFIMIGVYIVTNSLSDISAIYFTVRHLEKIRNDPRVTVAGPLLLKNLVYSFVFFFLSQLVSNLIWPMKANVDIPLLARFVSPAIVLWPYAFVLDASSSSSQYLLPIFPGQLLITGTVFLPTLIIVLLFIFSVLWIRTVGLLKRALVAYNLRLYRIVIAKTPGQPPVLEFSCINKFAIGLGEALVAALVIEWLKHILSFS
jgi:hypothetical protein